MYDLLDESIGGSPKINSGLMQSKQSKPIMHSNGRFLTPTLRLHDETT
jgi:hypothetical protein